MLLFEHEKQQIKLKGENNEKIIRNFNDGDCYYGINDVTGGWGYDGKRVKWRDNRD